MGWWQAASMSHQVLYMRGSDSGSRRVFHILQILARWLLRLLGEDWLVREEKRQRRRGR